MKKTAPLNAALSVVVLLMIFRTSRAQTVTLGGPAFSFSVTTNVPLTVTALASIHFAVVPNAVTIWPVGKTAVVFTVSTLDNTSDFIVTSIPVTLTVLPTTYLGFGVTGVGSKTVDLTPSQSVAVNGVTTRITRLFYQLSWQSFNQLTGVTISNLTSNSTWTVYDSFSVPLLMCKIK